MPFRLKHGALTFKQTTECVGRAASLSEMSGKGGGRFIGGVSRWLKHPKATAAAARTSEAEPALDKVGAII
jgi:hypothetical protein